MFTESYEKRINGNCLILEEKDETEEKNEFQVRMLVENKILGLLPCSLRLIDGREQFLYDITSKQSVKVLYEARDMVFEDLKGILLGLIKGFEAINEYFLNEEHLILTPDYLYMDIETKQVFLCFYPYYHVNAKLALQQFAEYLLQKTEHADEKAVVLAYDFYRQIMKEEFSIGQMRKKIAEQSEVNKEEYSSAFEKTEEAPKENISEELILKSEGTENKIVIYSAIVFVVLIGFVLYIDIYDPIGLKNIISYERMVIMIAVIGAVTGCAAVSAFLKQHKRKKELSSICKSAETSSREVSSREYYGETTCLNQKELNAVHRLVYFNEEDIMEFKLTKLPFIIGKKKAVADLILEHAPASRMHAKIYALEEQYFLVDLNSTNGTCHNGVRLNANESVELKYNDEVSFAGKIFYFR